MNGFVLANNWKIADGNSAIQTALSNASYPASGSFVDVSGVERFHIVVKMGALADAITFTIQTAETVSGSLTTLDTSNLTHVTTATDDGEYVVWTIETAYFPADAKFVTVTVSGVSGNNYAAITYYLPEQSLPVTQTTAVLPTASQHVNGT